jgi:preprotein translocase subunit SecA
MFCEAPIVPRNDDGELRLLEDAEVQAATLVEHDTFRKELYARWGLPVEVIDREAADVYEELLDLVPLALTEQRDRLLDLLDRIVGAIVEDSCPVNKNPDDWDWDAVFEGFQQHFHVELPDEVADYGDREALAADLYERGEAAYKEREEKTGLELILRIFRHLYLEELDKTWVEHLTDMDHLRDGIGLRGYGQKDPKQEYKKEGYNMFVTMLARVSSNVVTKVMTVQVRAAEEEQLEAADLDRHMKDLANAIARHGGEVVPASPSSPGLSVEPEEPPVGAEMVCPCGSGKKFMKCHGADMGVEDRTV